MGRINQETLSLAKYIVHNPTVVKKMNIDRLERLSHTFRDQIWELMYPCGTDDESLAHLKETATRFHRYDILEHVDACIIYREAQRYVEQILNREINLERFRRSANIEGD